MKKHVYILLSLCLVTMSYLTYAGGFKRFSYGNPPPSPVFNANARPVIQTQQQTPGNPATCSVGWSSSNYQSYLSDLQQLGLPAPSAISLICSAVVNGQTYSNSVAIPANHNGAISVSTPTLPSGSAMLSTTIQDTGGSVLYAQAQSAPSAIPEVIGAILTNPNLVGASLDLTLTDLNGVLDSSTTIDADILNNLSALNAEIDEADHGCTLDGGASATAAQGRDYLICVMEAHYGDTLQAAIASFTAPSSTELVTCNGSNLCGPAPAICAEAVWVCSIVPNSIPATGTLTHDLSGPQTEPVNFGGIDIAQSLSTASYSINIQLSTYANPVQATSFTYSNLALPSDVYLAPQSSTTGLADASIVPLVDTQIETSNGFSFVNAQNSVTYSATLSDGTALPSWLSIDSATGMLSGVPPIGYNSALAITVTATDALNASATSTQNLSVSSSVPTAAQAQYASSPAQIDELNQMWAIHSDPLSWGSFAEQGPATTGSRLAHIYDGGGTPAERARTPEVLSLLNIESVGYNANGLSDANGHLVTVSDASGTANSGYLVVGVGTRANAAGDYAHAMLQLVPLSGSSVFEYGNSVYLTNKAYGIYPDTESDATGSVVISGTNEEYQTLSSDISSISDPDGMNDITYQWLNDGSAIAGATSSTFVLSGDEVGGEISLQISYMDRTGFSEVLTSGSTSPILAANLMPQSSSLALNASDTYITSGQTTQFSVTGVLGNGTISYAVTSGDCTVSDSGLLSAPSTTGTCAITGNVAESTTHSAGATDPITLNIVSSQTAQFASAPSSISVGSNYQIVINSQGGNGGITYAITLGSCSVNNSGSVTASSAGQCTITATIAGTSTHDNAELTQTLSFLDVFNVADVKITPYTSLSAQEPVHTAKTGWATYHSNGSINRIFAVGQGNSAWRSSVMFEDSDGNALQVEKVDGYGTVANNTTFTISWSWNNFGGGDYHTKLRFRSVDSDGNATSAWSSALKVNRIDTVTDLNWNAWQLGNSANWSVVNGVPRTTLPLVSGVNESDINFIPGGGNCAPLNTNSPRVILNHAGNDISDASQDCAQMAYFPGNSSRSPWFSGLYSSQGFYQYFPMPKIVPAPVAGCEIITAGSSCPNGKELARIDQMINTACGNININTNTYDHVVTQRNKMYLDDDLPATISIRDLVKQQYSRDPHTGVSNDGYSRNTNWSHLATAADPETTLDNTHAAVCVNAPPAPTQCQMVQSQGNTHCGYGWRLAKNTTEMLAACGSETINMASSSVTNKLITNADNQIRLAGTTGSKTITQFVNEGTVTATNPQWHGDWQDPATWNACVK